MALKEKLTPDLAVVRFKAALDFPYFQSILFGLIPIERKDDPNVQTMGVDKHMRLYYNPDLLLKITKEEAVGVLIHEINHIIRDHHRRGIGYEPTLFNMAGDMEINDDIVSDRNCGVQLPDWTISPKKPPSFYTGKALPENELAEFYYEKLLEKAKDLVKIKAGALVGSGSCGSAANGTDGEGELPADGKAGNEGHSESVVDYYRKATAEAILDHAKNRGTVPAGLERWAKKLLKPKVDWKKDLRSMITSTISSVISGMSDYTYTKISRRQHLNKRIVFPGHIAYTPTVGVIQDTSGSMSDKYLQQSVTEIGSVLKATGANVLFVDVDAAVGNLGPIKKISDIKLSGGGGTDMCIGYKALSEYKTKPQIVICITDGYTPWPAEPIPNTKNIVCIITTAKDDALANVVKGIPSWAKVVIAEVDND